MSTCARDLHPQESSLHSYLCYLSNSGSEGQGERERGPHTFR